LVPQGGKFSWDFTMTAAPSFSSGFREYYADQLARVKSEFLSTGNGRAVLAARTALVEHIVLTLWNEIAAAHERDFANLALGAIGGFGRGWLFPCSDIDLLILAGEGVSEDRLKDPIRYFSRELWDVGLRLSPTTRTLPECERLDRNNAEFTISLLDARFLGGDGDLFTRLHQQVLPRLLLRESQSLVQDLAEITRARHTRFGNTVYHLEPNLKETPGGLRDYNVASWLALVSAVNQSHAWPVARTQLPPEKQLAPALDFLMSVRCFLHFRHGRDDNTLTWEAQDEAAARRIGVSDSEVADTAAWMRLYFGHARSIHRGAIQLLEEVPASWSSLYRHFQSWRSRVSNADFSVIGGMIFLRQPASVEDPAALLRVFQFIAHHGLRLSTTAEQRIQQALPAFAVNSPRGASVWSFLQDVLNQPHAAEALRSMQALHVLPIVLPELKGIDALVVRDYYHRFTVDEHTFLTIDNLHRLRAAESEWDKRFAEILKELEQPELLFLSLLLHDTGKAVPEGSHVQASLEFADQALDRLGLDARDRETVRFLIRNHLEMSLAARRDIFALENVRAFADKVGTAERLKMLCLMTYADIAAVSPEALTPWKAENLWRLYIAAANQLSRSMDQRLHVRANDADLVRLKAAARFGARKIQVFLEGLPTRYLQAYSAEEVVQHLAMAVAVTDDAPVQTRLQPGRHWYELTVVTRDRPFLFANLAGTLAAWAMNIVKADAFSNDAGIVVDTFYFTDRFRTLELNPGEGDRLQRSVSSVLLGEADLERMLRDRVRSEKNGVAKIKIPPSIEFDDACSPHSTLIQVIAQDRVGLLHQVSSCFARHQCNIDIALIDTEGQMAIDVFYLTSAGTKLNPELQESLRQILLEELQS
jgi:[protein-PII] uridylyltransferase